MAEREDEAAAEEKKLVETKPQVEEAENLPLEDSREVQTCLENEMPSQQQEEEIVKKKYGGLLQKKPPLISKDNERAFFDSADWALGKKSKGPLEALRPKLQMKAIVMIHTMTFLLSNIICRSEFYWRC